jgi:galactokinase
MSEKEKFATVGAFYEKEFHEKGVLAIFAPGRLEILGNHTDHNHGHCLVAGCSLGIRGYAAKTTDHLVSVASLGYGRFAFPVTDLGQKDAEKSSSIALTRGVLAYLKNLGYAVGGFHAALSSDIFPGAGVSSSAAYELFIGEAVNLLFNEGKIARIDLAKAGQYAENVYFGKGSGLLDQCGSSFGAVQYLDFKNPDKPLVEPLIWPDWKLRIVLVNPGASHAGLSDLYSEMPLDMKKVAKTVFGKEVLGDVQPAEFFSRIHLDNPEITERQRLRAIHFFEEDARVLRAKEALLNDDRGRFLELERETSLSSTYLLKNAMIPSNYKGSPLEAVERAYPVIGEGASRVMGGGLVGSTINFVPEANFAEFMKVLQGFYGEKKVVEVAIPPVGACPVVLS